MKPTGKKEHFDILGAQKQGKSLLIIGTKCRRLEIEFLAVEWKVTTTHREKDPYGYRYPRVLLDYNSSGRIANCRITGPRHLLEKLLEGLGFAITNDSTLD